MADLRDIAPTTSVEAVWLSGGPRLVVRGLNVGDIAAIFGRFPAMVMLAGGGDDSMPMRLVTQFGTAVGPVIAAGCNCLGDEKAEANAGALPLMDQLKMITTIYRLTFPNGFGPVMEAATAIMNSGALDVPKQKPVRVRLKKSPSTLRPSSGPDSRPIMQ